MTCISVFPQHRLPWTDVCERNGVRTDVNCCPPLDHAQGLYRGLHIRTFRSRRSLYLFSNTTGHSDHTTFAFERSKFPFTDAPFSRSISILLGIMGTIPSVRPLATHSLVSRVVISYRPMPSYTPAISALVRGTGCCAGLVSSLCWVALARSPPTTSAVCVTAPSAHFKCAVLSSCTLSLSSV